MLAHRLSHVCAAESVVLGVARGGVPIAYEIARRLSIPLDVLVVRRGWRDTDRKDAGRVPLDGRTAIVVDDGVASPATALAACRLARQRGARRVVFAAPVVAADAVPALSEIADDLPRLATPPRVADVRDWYGDYPPVTESQVRDLLGRAATALDAGI